MKSIPIPESLLKARRELLLDHPFFGSLVLNLTPVVDPTCKTIWVDGNQLGVNPEFFNKLERAEGAGVIAHETLHCALEHHLRRGDRDPKLWNDAADYVVNPIVLRSGLKLPEGYLEDPQFDGKTVEEVYYILKQAQENQQQQQPQPAPGGQQQGQQPSPASGNGPAGKEQGTGNPDGPPTGEVRDGKGENGKQLSEAEARQQSDAWKTAVQQAVNNAKGQGTYPTELERTVNDEILTPKVDWREQLRRFFQSISRTEATWSRANRRFIGSGLYLPGLRTEVAGALVVGIDTSGSIGARLLEQFAGELNAIIEDTKPERVYVVYCDARVGRVEEFTPDDLPVTLQPVGGGGTAFGPVFDWAEEQGLQPDCLVYLTDMMGSFPAEEPSYPVVWASTSKRDTAPFGEVIHISETF